MTALRVDPARAALLVVDVQDRLWRAMPEDERGAVQRNLLILVELARRLHLPVVWSEQYPRGLGPTVAEVAAALAAPELAVHRLEKMEFSCVAAPGFAAIWNALPDRQWLLGGMETHVCVYQTARDLRARGADVQVAADAVISRTRENRAIGLELIARTGAVVTSTETMVFDALQTSGTEDFRALSKLVR